MSAAEKLLNEEQSAELAGVTLETIRQYVQFGLLDNIGEDDETLIRAGDVTSLFHLGSKEVSSEEAPAKPGLRLVDDEPTSETAAGNELGEELSALRDDIIMGKGLASTLVAPQQKNTSQKPVNFTLRSEVPRESNAFTPPLKQTAADKEVSKTNSSHGVELIEINKNLREQLKMVREERDWLRERLEKLETRSEREQMLLLAESETVRGLLSERGQKRGFLARFALPWIK